MPRIVLDTDFLSAFLKIGRMDLIRTLYQVENVQIPPAVYREVAQTTLLPRLAKLSWVQVSVPDADVLTRLTGQEGFQALGAGERECIALALGQPDAVLMMNDNKARQVAAQYGLTVINIPAFLLACKWASILDQADLETLIDDLQEKDHYGFRPEVLAMLLDSGT
ncbi:hypothetical protein [Thermogutta sp.]|uniref:hypothetical protein n=1 Tax=Thermogutta sp. TaxID=1962930 RepID=UPI00322099AA